MCKYGRLSMWHMWGRENYHIYIYMYMYIHVYIRPKVKKNKSKVGARCLFCNFYFILVKRTKLKIRLFIIQVFILENKKRLVFLCFFHLLFLINKLPECTLT